MDFQHALRDDRLQLLGIGTGGKREAALELALEPLLEYELLRVLVACLRPPALDPQRVIGQFDRELLLL